MSLRRFARYALIGIGNTLVHGLVFFAALALGANQALGNLLAFCVAATLSFQLNARYTFAVDASGRRYLAFLLGMGGISLASGALADRANLPPWLTLVGFSLVSLVLGYGYSRTVVFRRRRP